MRYFGSKSSSVERVYQLVAGRMPSGSFCDSFSGIGIVGAFFKRKGYTIWCGGVLTSAHYFQLARVERNRHPSFRKLRGVMKLMPSDIIVQNLNSIQGRYGWFVREYSERRKFFTRLNGLRINACRLRINRWWREGLPSRSEYAVLLAYLINSIDKVIEAPTYRNGLKFMPDDLNLHYNLGVILKAQGQIDEAIKELHIALKRDINSAKVRKVLRSIEGRN